MKRFRFPIFLHLMVMLAISINPVLAAPVDRDSAQETVTASAIVVPAQVSRLGFFTSALASQVLIKEGDAVRAGQALVVLDIPELEFAVTAAEAELRSAQADEEFQSHKKYKVVKHGKVYFSIAPSEVRQLTSLRVQQTQAALEIAQATLAQGTLTAPYDATAASVDIIPGEFVEQGQTVITLATLNNLQIETTDLSERDITKIKIGDPANIFIEALNKTLTGKIINISPKADTLGGDVVFKVTLALDEQPDGLLWGMTAEVTIGGK